MKRYEIALVCAVVAGLALQSSPTFAGKPHNRSGFYIGFGLGLGGANWTEGSALDGSTEDSGGGAVNFRLGGELIDKATIVNGSLQFNWYW